MSHDRFTHWKTLIHRQVFDSWGRKRRLADSRPNSFPFISGDTFRDSCEVVYAGPHSLDELGMRPARVFCDLPLVQQLAHDLRAEGVSRLDGSVIIMHNGDALPGLEVMTDLLRIFDRVFAVNAGKDMEALGVVAIPQGLENCSIDRSGRVQDYPRPHEWRSIPEWIDRPTSCLASFRVSTNPNVRIPLRSEIARSDVDWLEPSNDQRAYLVKLKQSRFVISPKGNGPDCHRTWEALYWGCVPVIEEGTLAPSLSSELPVVEVNDFREFLQLDSESRNELGKRALAKSAEKAWMNYWCSLL